MQVTYGLMVVIGLVSYLAWKRSELQSRLLLNPYETYYQKQYWRLLTSGFVHNGPLHLFLNLFTLYFFGAAIEQIFTIFFQEQGILLYLVLFFTAIIVANVPTMLKHKNNPRYNSLGASGGVSALVLAFILFDPLRQLCLYLFICLPGYILGAIFIAYSIIMGRRGRDNINHDAHLWGAVFGVIFVLLLRPSTVIAFLDQVFLK
ncbi:rhomboid family intramembrane serine protease [Roseivirga thermotolerans]|uniref:Rhomboid family intramembrane serine protease n=1 Tax=Roseivirga thermotolerans TaxID=1758176 RepID=A0ABQ3I5G8_9BACT|nr:rhomboid family intramembrane serine protease [Roseivirga thermotolerans]GHE56180.1 rhomboid family intramembrane serine protease [Roseivirga thermotolerans]